MFWTFSTHTCFHGPSFIFISLLGILGGPSRFEPRSWSPSFVDLYPYYDYVRLSSCGPQVGPFPSRPILGSIRGEGTPPQPLAIIWERKERSPSWLTAPRRLREETNYRRRRHTLTCRHRRTPTSRCCLPLLQSWGRCCKRRHPYHCSPTPCRRRPKPPSPPPLKTIAAVTHRCPCASYTPLAPPLSPMHPRAPP